MLSDGRSLSAPSRTRHHPVRQIKTLLSYLLYTCMPSACAELAVEMKNTAKIKAPNIIEEMYLQSCGSAIIVQPASPISPAKPLARQSAGTF
jgi:hypothetical protein